MKLLHKALPLSLLILCFIALFGGNAYAVKLSNGEYEVVVAIDPAMPYTGNETKIADIHAMMKGASTYLHNALKQQGRFSKVIILIPDGWPDSLKDATAAGESVAGADIFIGNNIGCGACASAGRIEIDDGSMAGSTVVHEWGHYRFGLGDEYCDYVYKNNAWYQVYHTSAGWNRCTALQEIERDCDERIMNEAGCTITKNNVNGAKAAIMHRQGNTGIDSFCDDSTDDKYKHNADVNNHQNRIWDSRSNWSVIEAHADGFKYSGGTTIAYSDPVFEVKKASKADIVLVADVSPSMSLYSRIDNAARAAKNFVDRLEQDSYVGIVKFCETASLEKSLTKITDTASRTDVKNKVPTTTMGATTSIGSAMQQAITELSGSTHGLNKVMVLLTDGEENTAPMIAEVTVPSDIKVYAVGLGAASDAKLQDLATKTGGVYYFAQDGDIQALNEAYTSVANNIQSSPASTVVSQTNPIPADGATTFTGLLDRSLGGNTIFSFSGEPAGMAGINAVLEQPDGSIINSSYAGYSEDGVLGVIMFRIDGVAQPGTWTATLTNSGPADTNVTMELTSSRAPDQAPLTLTVWTSAASVAYPTPVAIYASLMSTESIIGARVWAEVTDPSNNITSLLLTDNGQGADKFPRDAVYSAYFTNYRSDGRYSVRVFADNASNTAKLGSQFNDRLQSDEALFALPGNWYATPGDVTVARRMFSTMSLLNFNFERVTGAGGFEVLGYQTGDNIPPGRIVTLSVQDMNQDPPGLVLGWIATGDDMDNGQAALYDMRHSTARITADNFDAALPITGLNQPKPAGEEEQYTVPVQCNRQYFFSLKAIDEVGNHSDLSNVINARLDDIIPPFITAANVKPDLLWPPNHRMVPVKVSVSSTDNCGPPQCKITAVTSNEPVNGLGDGDTAPDWAITGDLTVNLRAERSGSGRGRIYTITVNCADGAGNSSSKAVTVGVPKDQKK